MSFDKHPLSLLDDPERYVEWVGSVSTQEAEAQMNEAVREHMAENGTRSVLDVAEKMDDCIAWMEEFVLDVEALELRTDDA